MFSAKHPLTFLVCHVLRSGAATFRFEEANNDIRDDETLPDLQTAIDQKEAH
jgi:hypothetical protein